MDRGVEVGKAAKPVMDRLKDVVRQSMAYVDQGFKK